MAAATALSSVDLPELEFPGDAVDLLVPDLEGNAIDRPDLPLDAEMARAVVGFEVFYGKHGLAGGARGWAFFLPADGRGRGHAPPSAPMRRSRLRGSICSFIDTASRNRPMNRATTKMTGKAIHHHTPATSAVC